MVKGEDIRTQQPYMILNMFLFVSRELSPSDGALQIETTETLHAAF